MGDPSGDFFNHTRRWTSPRCRVTLADEPYSLVKWLRWLDTLAEPDGYPIRAYRPWPKISLGELETLKPMRARRGAPRRPHGPDSNRAYRSRA